MIKNYLKIGLRNLWKYKAFSSINVFGLAFALACCLFIGVYIQNELSFDRFHTNASSIYRVAFKNFLGQGAYAATSYPIGPAMKEQLPEVKAMSRFAEGQPFLMSNETNKGFEKLFFADPEFINIFSFPFKEGDATNALKEPSSIIISESLARKYFGNESPLNKNLKIGSTGALSSVVKGVFKDISHNSHLKFDCLLPFSTYEKMEATRFWRQMPGNYTYVLLQDKASVASLEQKLKGFVQKNIGEDLKKEKNASYDLMLQPLLSIHLNSHLQGERPGGGSLTYIYLLTAIGFIILIIACFNFVNFSVANGLQRIKEIGVRKVIGAGKGELIKQFLAESLVVFFLSSLFALLFVQLLLPFFNTIAERGFGIGEVINQNALLLLITGGLIVGFIAGIFPSLSITKIASIDALKGRLSGLGNKSAVSKVLVTIQFVASIALIASAIIIYQQMQYARRLAKSIEGDQVIVFRMNGKLQEKQEVLKAKLLSHSGIENVSASANVPGFNFDGWPVRINENAVALQAQNYVADDNYIETMGLQLVAGRKLEKENGSDVREGFIINETASRELGFQSPKAALNKQILWGGDEKKRGKIIGVVKDFHITSLHEKISPAVIQFAPYEWMTYSYLIARLKPEQVSSALSFIRKTVIEIDPSWLVDYKFFDENFAALHAKEEQQGRVFTAFAGVAILISCLGLLGLTIYATQRRIKEIGIRKVLGASAGSIVAMVSKDFLKLVGIALVIATPIAWYFMNRWLQDFAYRINITPWTILLAGIFALAIAFLSISLQAIKAALANPIKNLRTE